MALGVTIVGGGGPTTYRLEAESVSIVFDRSPIQAPLPGADPLLLDLGMFRPSINIEGKVPVTAGSDGGVTIPSKNNLEDAVESWYNTTITVTILGDSYTAKIASCAFSMPASREEVWDYRLHFLALSRT